MLDNTPNQPSKIRTTSWVVINARQADERNKRMILKSDNYSS